MNSSSSQPQSDAQNQILQTYLEWKNRTPLITRSTLQTLTFVYASSWIFDFSSHIANIPYFTLLKLEFYRLLLAPFLCQSLFSLVFVGMSFSSLGARLEQILGSGGFLSLMVSIALLSHLSFVLLASILFYLFNDVSAMFYSAQGFWSVLMGLIVIESHNSPQPTRRLLFLPFQIPTPYYPLALIAFFTLFMGVKMDMLLSTAVGYGIVNNKLDFVMVKKETLVGWEAEGGFLSYLGHREGWVGASNSSGFEGVAVAGAFALPINSPAGRGDGRGDGGGGGGGGGGFNPSTFFGGQQQQQQQQQQQPSAGLAAPGKVSKPSFPGGGSTLGAGSNGARGGGTVVAPPAGGWSGEQHLDPREAARRAAEARTVSSREVV